MTARRRSAAPDGDDEDLAAAPLTDDAARAESAWLQARDEDPDAPPPSPEIAREYAELEDLLGNLPMAAPDGSWTEDVLRAASASAPARPWWRGTASRWVLAGAAVAAAAVALLVWIPRRATGELEVAIVRGHATRSDVNEAAIGDRLIVTARPDGAGDLRIFHSDGTLVARCPGSPACRGAYSIELTLDAPIQYQVILVVGMSNASPDETMDAFLDAARSAKARIVRYPPIDVR